MPRTTKRLSPLKGKRVRVTRLDACGRPVYGDDAQVATKGFITVGVTANISESDEIRQTNANGETCLLEPSVPSLDGATLEVQFCDVDPDLFSIMTGATVIYDANDVAVGFEVSTDVDMDSYAFALELWTGIKTDTACGEVGDVPYGYVLFPFVKGGVVGDYTIENGAVTFTVSNSTTRDGNSWGSGPYNVEANALGVAVPLITPVGVNAPWRFMETLVAPPESVPGSRPVLDPSWTLLTAVTGTTAPASLAVDFAVTPELEAGEGVWYEFGDGTWDFVAEPGDITHTYAEAGTYTVRASTNNTWVTTTVTVPGA